MRKKMLDAHPNNSSLFDIKHDRGGMVDIEFMVQYLILAHAHAHPEFIANSGSLALLMLASKLGLVEVQLAREVCDIYRMLRAIQHKMRLNNQSPGRVDLQAVDTAPVKVLWGILMGEGG